MSFQAENRPDLETGPAYYVSFVQIGKRALDGVNNFFASTAHAIDSLDLTTHIEINVPDKNFKLMNAGVNAGQLILDGLSGVGTKKEIVPKVASPSL